MDFNKRRVAATEPVARLQSFGFFRHNRYKNDTQKQQQYIYTNTHTYTQRTGTDRDRDTLTSYTLHIWMDGWIRTHMKITPIITAATITTIIIATVTEQMTLV